MLIDAACFSSTTLRISDKDLQLVSSFHLDLDSHVLVVEFVVARPDPNDPALTAFGSTFPSLRIGLRQKDSDLLLNYSLKNVTCGGEVHVRAWPEREVIVRGVKYVFEEQTSTSFTTVHQP